MKTPSLRLMYSFGFLAVSFLYGIVTYLQYAKGYQPCPLCLLQRGALLTLGVFFLLGALPLKKGWRLLSGLFALLSASVGVLFAGRQVWLQYFPHDNSGDCGASLQYMMQAYPFLQVLQKIFAGTPDCSHKDWELLGISLAGWSCLCFLGFMLFVVWQLCRDCSKVK